LGYAGKPPSSLALGRLRCARSYLVDSPVRRRALAPAQVGLRAVRGPGLRGRRAGRRARRRARRSSPTSIRQAALTVALAAIPFAAGAGHAARPLAKQPKFPIRAAFFYDWFPEAWRQQGLDPFTHYSPSRGFYDSGSRSVIAGQIAAMRYAHLDAAIVSWWGRGSRSDARLPRLLAAAPRGFHWSIYYEQEGVTDPSPSAIRRDLLYLRRRAASSSHYLRIGGRFVVFVYAQPSDGCEMARRWRTANTVGAYVVLKVFPGYRACPAQPEGWHQYSPDQAEDDQRPYSFSISPGFYKATEATPRLARDPAAWAQAARAMVASRARFQLVTTFNEWGEGTAVESARQWQSPSGFGSYLDTLHAALPARSR
jgi:hypothetical protein